MNRIPGLSELKDLVIVYLPNLVGALLILVGGVAAARLARALLRKVLRKSRVDATLVSFLENVLYSLLLIVVGIAALDRLGVNTTSLAAVLAAAGLAVALSLQGSLSNFAAGVMIILLRPFKVGDVVEAAGQTGTVEEVNILFTCMKTGDNKVIVLPNSRITGDTLVNHSAKSTRRIDLVVGVGYGDDLVAAKRVIHEVIAAEARVLAEPAPVVAVSELADSSVQMVVRPWVETADYWPVRFELTEAIKRALDAHGITIPFPQREVHLNRPD